MERHSTWLLVYRYPDMQSAGEPFTRARDIVFGEDIDASAYRVQINGVPHVVVLGEGTLAADLRRRFEIACTGGVAVDLPADVRAQLLTRRREGRIPGAFWERRSL